MHEYEKESIQTRSRQVSPVVARRWTTTTTTAGEMVAVLLAKEKSQGNGNPQRRISTPLRPPNYCLSSALLIVVIGSCRSLRKEDP